VIVVRIVTKNTRKKYGNGCRDTEEGGHARTDDNPGRRSTVQAARPTRDLDWRRRKKERKKEKVTR
jgi:hypothetical protein